MTRRRTFRGTGRGVWLHRDDAGREYHRCRDRHLARAPGAHGRNRRTRRRSRSTTRSTWNSTASSAHMAGNKRLERSTRASCANCTSSAIGPFERRRAADLQRRAQRIVDALADATPSQLHRRPSAHPQRHRAHPQGRQPGLATRQRRRSPANCVRHGISAKTL